jgi:hypothetical protein
MNVTSGVPLVDGYMVQCSAQLSPCSLQWQTRRTSSIVFS